jgi:Uncharacterized conserved protein (DUF2075)
MTPPVSAWASFTLGNATEIDVYAVIGKLTTAAAMAGFDSQWADQTIAWREQVQLIQQTARALTTRVPGSAAWTVLLEYPIPRRGKRIDAVLLADHFVVVIEFKIGKSVFDRSDLWQTEDYVLDLRDFHEASRGVHIEGVLVATAAKSLTSDSGIDAASRIYKANSDSLAETLSSISAQRAGLSGQAIDAGVWASSGYRPTPTIVEAARQVFAGHNIRALSHAYADNLTTTTDAIAAAIRQSRAEFCRTVCFVTGVPGAGKTLAGLTAMQDARALALGEGAASFMSGNGPLVGVLREALARDRAANGGTRKAANREVKLLVQNVHQFLAEYGVDKPTAVPPDHVISFDEAQRAWHAGKLRKRHKSLTLSEPGLVLDIMARPADWSVVVALVGGGQEIHDGEAGLEEWGRALESCGKPWTVVVSPEVIAGGESVAGHRLFPEAVPPNVRLLENRAMHLSVSVRAPRAQRLAEWVNSVLRADSDAARRAKSTMHGFRVLLTRDLSRARAWLREASTGESRSGLLASSGALRLRAHGLELDADFLGGYPIDRWFLDGPDDFRSSHSLEVAMAEFECQGLELDYVGLCWGDDFTIRGSPHAWHATKLYGRHWRVIKEHRRLNYIVNKYRVLLTRAREGIVIWVPRGDITDPTRPPEPLDATADFLLEAGAVSLD